MTTLPALMPEPQFWQLLTHIDRSSLLAGDEVAGMEPLSAALLALPPSEIVAFALRLAERLEALLIASRQRHAPFNDDGLLYSACGAIARGQAWFEASRKHSGLFDGSTAPDDNWCESLLYVARNSWSQSAGRPGDDFPVWTLEQGLQPFASSMPPQVSSHEPAPLTGDAASATFRVYCHFDQHPSLARTVEPGANLRVGMQDLSDDFFWCLLDLGDYLGLIDEAGQSFQCLYDASKNLYWAEIPDESARSSCGQEYSREALLDLLARLPKRFSAAIFDVPQTLAWDE